MRRRFTILAIALAAMFGAPAVPPALPGIAQAQAQDYLGLGGGRGRPGGEFFRGGERNQRYQGQRRGEERMLRRERERQPRFERRERPRLERGERRERGGGQRREW